MYAKASSSRRAPGSFFGQSLRNSELKASFWAYRGLPERLPRLQVNAAQRSEVQLRQRAFSAGALLRSMSSL